MFIDRVALYPNRYRVIPDSGEPYYVTLVRADAPSVEGTPLNAATFNELLPKPVVAKVGQFLRVSEVDENGKIVAVEAVDLNAIVDASI